ncbi:MAG TPA: DUF6036 family nucleotidyltransferase [Candidatus Angelobacter sp.]
MPHNTPLEPWHSFLSEIDEFLSQEVCLHCLGGFVVTELYGLPRPTVDIDTLAITPDDQSASLMQKAGRGSALEKKHKVYLDFVTVCTPPEDYETRLSEMFPGVYTNLRLLALDPYDLALAKIGRNNERDREDVLRLAKKIPFDLDVLKERYEKELRLYVNQEREDLTLQLWIEMIEEDRQQESL